MQLPHDERLPPSWTDNMLASLVLLLRCRLDLEGVSRANVASGENTELRVLVVSRYPVNGEVMSRVLVGGVIGSPPLTTMSGTPTNI